MAGSRFHKIGTIFTRTTGLMRSGAMKPQDKPLWYDIYEAFPPKYEPKFDRPVQETEIPDIFYSEDVIRAASGMSYSGCLCMWSSFKLLRKFYKKYGSPGKIILFDTKRQLTLCQLFVKEYERLQADGLFPEDQLMEETALALEAQGIYLDRSRAPPKTETSHDMEVAVEKSSTHDTLTKKQDKIRLADVFKESQEGFQQ
ncbi:small ribosomal subunit protein mS23 isoform X1 [Panulirus ornatus]|uniref:small ribosomal subunit protein mS23 isoform X1 n=1 Tax=Panulirus ornatus TaxID=150431 RepID=UPI003A85B0E1